MLWVRGAAAPSALFYIGQIGQNVPFIVNYSSLSSGQFPYLQDREGKPSDVGDRWV